MSKELIASLKYTGIQVAIYGGLTVFISGVLGGLLNTIVFLSLKTFRQSSCAFYLTIMSILNIGQLLTGLLSRIMLYISAHDGTDSSLFYCKFRLYFSHISVMISLTCFCLSTIDQYCATCSYPRLQKFCNIKLARRLVIISSLFWVLHGIPYIVFNQHIITNKGTISCTMTNTIYIEYRSYFIVLILLGFLPFTITILFGLMAYRNLQQLSHCTIPIVRRELDRQLTNMVLVQVMFNFVTLLPYAITDAISQRTEFSDNSLIKAQFQLATHITLLLYYVYYANPFYIYICASERFRRQLVFVLFKMHLKKCKQQPIITINQVMPSD